MKRQVAININHSLLYILVEILNQPMNEVLAYFNDIALDLHENAKGNKNPNTSAVGVHTPTGIPCSVAATWWEEGKLLVVVQPLSRTISLSSNKIDGIMAEETLLDNAKTIKNPVLKYKGKNFNTLKTNVALTKIDLSLIDTALLNKLKINNDDIT